MRKIIIVALVAIAAIVGAFASEGKVEVLLRQQTSPVVTSAATMSPVATSVPTAAPVATKVPEVLEPAVEAFFHEELDGEHGKFYYKASHADLVVANVRKDVTAREALDAVRAESLGASYVTSRQDHLLTAFELLTDEEEFFFFRNGGLIPGFNPEKAEEFQLNAEKTPVFSGLADSKARKTWFCEEHGAIKVGVIRFEGYPEAENALGIFRVSKGFSVELLKAVRLYQTDEERYDWCLFICDCAIRKSNGSGSGTKQEAPTVAPTVEPTPVPTPVPTPTPTPVPTPTPTPVPTPTPTPVPTLTPTPVPTPTPTPVPTPTPTPVPTPTPTPVPTRAPAHEEPPVTLAPIVTRAPAHEEPPVTLAPIVTKAPAHEEPPVTLAPIVTKAPAHEVSPDVPKHEVPTLAPIVTEAPSHSYPTVTEKPPMFWDDRW